MDFKISNHPYAPTITREAKLTGMSIDILNSKLVLNLLIKHYVDGVYIPEMDKVLDSIANNNHTFPHPYGQGEIGEFDYWMFLYNNNLPLSQMLSNGISNIDATGLINRKCEYSVPLSLTTTTTEYTEPTTTEYVEETTTKYIEETTTEYIEETTTTTEYVEETTTTEYVEETTTTTEYIEETTTTEYVEPTTTTEYFEETTTTTTEFPVEETTTTEYVPEIPSAPKKSFWSFFTKS